MTFITDEQAERTVDAIDADAFTVFDFVRHFSSLYPEDWNHLLVAYGEKGDGRGRGYTALTYLGNRLSQLTKKPGGPLLPLVRWQRGGVETPNQRRATAKERAMGAEGMIRVFRKRG